jgi:TonB family protein
VESEPQPEKFRITRERAVFISIIAHLLLLLLVITVKIPERKELPLEQTPDPLGLLALMKADPTPPPIPIQFFPAPGPRAPAPGPRPLPSDMDRVAHGGDPKLPKMTQPREEPKPGIQDLDTGKKGQIAAVATPAAPPSDYKSQVGEKGESSRPSAYDDPEAMVHRRPAQPSKLKGIPDQVLAGLTAEQAARAAREGRDAGGGDEGGGYDRDGGFVDSGPLSFDTVGYDWGAYAAEMIRKIKRNWDIPSLAHYGIRGRLTIRFFILKDGRVEAERIISSSGIPPFDNASYQAISVSSPFRPLPADLGHDKEGVTITFFYNIRPEDFEEPARRPDPRKR